MWFVIGFVSCVLSVIGFTLLDIYRGLTDKSQDIGRNFFLFVIGFVLMLNPLIVFFGTVNVTW